jgi:excisionase family DNA binding protein
MAEDLAGEFREMNTVTAAQAAEMIGVSRNAIYNAIARGHLPVLRVGATVRILEDDLAAYLVRSPGRPRKAQPPVAA